jgi:hypothetical protein
MLTWKSHLIILRVSLSHGVTGFHLCGCPAYMDRGREVKNRLDMKTVDKWWHYINSHKLKAYKYFTQTYYINIGHSNTASFLQHINCWLITGLGKSYEHVTLLSSITVFRDSIHMGSISPSKTIHFGLSPPRLAWSLIITEKRPTEVIHIALVQWHPSMKLRTIKAIQGTAQKKNSVNWRILSSGMWCRLVWYKYIEAWGEHATSIFMTLLLQGWR